MAYNNNFPIGYQPAQYYYPQTQNNMPMSQPSPQPTQSSNNIIWVQGEAGAKSYLVAPNQTVQLWDSEAQTIYLKSADASGMPSIKTLDYTIRENMPKSPEISSLGGFATKEDIEHLESELTSLKAKFERISAKSEPRKERKDG